MREKHGLTFYIRSVNV